MGRKTVLVDDLDGTELPEDTAPVNLSLGRTRYALYLSEKNYGKLMEAVGPFIENAEQVFQAPEKPERVKAAKAADKERNKDVREWAQSTGYTFTNAAGEEVKLGDRGRIPDAVFKAYDEANPDA